jgi:5-methylcytosine-specific restriction endonuclease McrBC GTP-binding regulatory subunit McrB
LGKVIGDYEYVADSPIRYNHFRKVEWIFVDENIPISEIYERGLSQKTMYKIDETALKQSFFTNKGQQEVIEKKEEKKYVLVIDEINRGNVSSIFGELITLIEKDKRSGKEEELEVTLPYSKETFTVPNNVYIVGTMNTADRSIEALDTALRRRFSFKEFPPKSNLIKTEGESGKVDGIVEDIDLEDLLNTINSRIEKLIDKDHKIGHSYFLKVDTIAKLKYAFANEIIPLLEEYFFGDFGKIGLVIGSTFVEKVNHDFSFADFAAYDNDIQEDLKEKSVFRIKSEDQWDFTKI